MNEIINAIPSYLITVTASVTFFVALKILHNFVEHKIVTAKTQQAKERWIYVQQLADTAVNSLVGKDIAGHEKFVQATAIVQSSLEKQGIKNVDLKAIEAAIQSAYEKSPLTSTISVTNPDGLGQKESNSVPDGKAKAIDPKEVA